MFLDWTMLGKLIPTKMKLNDKMIKSGIAGIFAASLELSRLGEIKIKQTKMFFINSLLKKYEKRKVIM